MRRRPHGNDRTTSRCGFGKMLFGVGRNSLLRSEPPDELYPKIAPILLKTILHMLLAAGIEMALIKHVVHAGGKVEITCQAMAQQGEIDYRIGAHRVLTERQPSAYKLSIDGSK